ncbi:MAG: transcription termination factor NusA [Pseudomonadota bacterium]|nr:transcription termination factor NusA [Pseudomonadota bacterium]
MTQNIITYIQVLAAEKNLEPEEIFIALELALATVTEKNFDEDVHLQCQVDRKTGETTYHRVWTVVEDDIEEFNNARHIYLKDTKQDYEGLEVGDHIVEDIELNLNENDTGNAEVGRIEIEKAKQVMLRAVRDAERAHNAKGYESQIGSLLTGEVSHVTRSAIIVDTGSVQAEISRADLIPKEIIRKGDRIVGCLTDINYHGRGPLLQLSRKSNEMLEALFRQEVPEIQEGLIQIRGSARDPGSRAKIAVKSNDTRIDPIGACIGVKGTRVQAISNELHGERVDIIKWDDDPAMLAINALSPATISSIEVNEETNTMQIAIDSEMLSQAIGRSGQNINLASQLVGWKLKIMSDEEAEEKQQAGLNKSIELFTSQLNVDKNVAEALATENIRNISDLANTSIKSIAKLDGFNKEVASELISRAQGHLLAMALEDNDDDSLMSVEGMDIALAEKLQANDVNTRDDLADMSLSELTEIVEMTDEKAGALILAARSHWFDDENE